EFRSYYKLPVPQTTAENCVAHNGSLIPIPGRDVMAQAWYQGGMSVFDFTDSRNPKEIAFFDRGPINANALTLGGLWSTYWYDGHIYGSEIARGFDAFKLTPSQDLDRNEIAAAATATVDAFNAQAQARLTWPSTFELVRAYYVQAVRAGTMSRSTATNVKAFIDLAEKFKDGPRKKAAAALLRAASAQLNPSDRPQATLRGALRDLAGSLT
ncbi:MAG TPA: hypothetical protein VFV66_00055, partial [Nonomuraea sp.]|nr:hypothetical protein [Nonomuraea sp.]